MSVNIRSSILRENLPLPYVHYPEHYGTFIAFSKNQEARQLYFCKCAEEGINNYLKYRESNKPDENAEPLRMAPLDSNRFPEAISRISVNRKENEVIRYKEELCHRCNMATPECEYCHPMYGGKFTQKYGWYIKQNFYRIGLEPSNFIAISDVCPRELLNLIKKRNMLWKKKWALEKIKIDFSTKPKNWIPSEDPHYKKIRELEKISAAISRKINNHVENITREEFGMRKIGDQWISETILFNIVERIMPGQKIIRHHRPSWLKGLELDVFLPKKKLAFEYQGQQHYYPVKAWGGQKSLEKLQASDKLKKQICRTENIRLIEVKYTEPLSESHIRERIKERHSVEVLPSTLR